MSHHHDLIPSLPFEIALDCLLRLPLQSHSTLRQVCRSWKSLISSPGFCSARQSYGYTDNSACLIQAMPQPSLLPPSPHGMKAPMYGVTIFNAKQQAWDRLPPIDDFPHGLPLFCQCAAVGWSVVLLGGWDPLSWAVLKSVYIYSFLSGQWRRGADMISVRSFFACGSLDGKIIVAGGHDDSKNALRTAEVYDPGLDVWEGLPDMEQERDECKAVAMGDKLMVISGYKTDSQGQFSRSAESFDFTRAVWESNEDMWVAGKAPSSILMQEGQLWALLEGKLMRYKEGQWEIISSVPSEVKVGACAAAVAGGILVLGSGGGSQPCRAFTCRLLSGTASWHKVDIGHDSGGLAQATCSVDL